MTAADRPPADEREPVEVVATYSNGIHTFYGVRRMADGGSEGGGFLSAGDAVEYVQEERPDLVLFVDAPE